MRQDSAAGTVDTATVACLSGSPGVAVGLGSTAFELAADEVDAQAGAQGGHHLYFAFRGTGLDVSDWTTVWITGTVKDRLVLEQGAQLGFACLDDGTALATGLLVGLPEEEHDEDFVFVVKLTDAGGTEVTDSMALQVHY